MADLQSQGVPIPNRLSGPQPTSQGAVNGPQTRTYKPRSSSASTQSVPRKASSPRRNSRGMRGPKTSNISPANFSPTRLADKSTSGVGLLEAEFLIGLAMLVLLMFANTTNTLADKIMSTMKRGTIICAVFFFLALIAGIGPHASKFAKAFGALVIVAIVVTAPVGTVLIDLDAIVKNDWVGSTEHGDDVSADKGTSGGTSESAQEIANNTVNKLIDAAVGVKSGSATANSLSASERAFESATGSSDSIGKLLNVKDEATGTWDTAKGIVDLINSAFHI